MGEPSGDPFWLTWTLGRLRGNKWEMTHSPDETQKSHLFKEGCDAWGCNFSFCFSMVPDGSFSLSAPPCSHLPSYIGRPGSPGHSCSTLHCEFGVSSTTVSIKHFMRTRDIYFLRFFFF